jgi:hypothetical protein
MTDNSEPAEAKRIRIMIVEDDALVALGVRCTLDELVLQPGFLS